MNRWPLSGSDPHVTLLNALDTKTLKSILRWPMTLHTRFRQHRLGTCAWQTCKRMTANPPRPDQNKMSSSRNECQKSWLWDESILTMPRAEERQPEFVEMLLLGKSAAERERHREQFTRNRRDAHCIPNPPCPCLNEISSFRRSFSLES